MHCDVESKVRALEQHPVEEVVMCLHDGLLTFRLVQILQILEGGRDTWILRQRRCNFDGR
jgi:hypothetical protein